MRRVFAIALVSSLCAILSAPMAMADVATTKRSAFEAQFEEIWQLILVEHIQPIEDTPQARMNCLFGMIGDGLRGCLQDNYAFYYSPAETKAFISDMAGEVGGIGLKLGRQGEYVRVTEVIPGSPAARSAMFALGDAIVEVDGENMHHASASYVASRIIGDVETRVTITIKRVWETMPPVVLMRERFVIPSVVAKTVGDVEVIKVSSFKINTPPLFERAVASAALHGRRKFVIDLRGDPGGNLDAALSIGCLFSGDPRDVLVTTFGRGPEDVSVDIAAMCSEEKRGEFFGLKFVVLVNEESASASEVIAALAKDWGFAKVVGTRTFGKGSVQRTFELHGGSLVQFTIAKYYVGNNFTEVDGVGVVPDIVVPAIPEGGDIQLRIAIKALK